MNFSDSAGKAVSAGMQVSNVPLPRPKLFPGYPIQVPGNELPSSGVALIVATDKDPRVRNEGRIATLPLPAPAPGDRWWGVTSEPGNLPYEEYLSFRADGRTFVADLTIGPSASGSDLGAIASIIRSLHILN